ncbi:MAG: ATP-binding cassette domain-containing protein [Verrucomicrobiota bacterium]|nr:ATP-binding cassette domain-containing protein [Verrucomicrobiota bacterium]MDP7050218.1 ATP-binding cassette domain-containing protein [Verrucomicrobiota bacterium]
MAARGNRQADSRWITVEGAREHNLRNLSIRIPRNQLVVVTGVSGSGKSTLAFDILFSEGQRRFLDSLNAYARQFVEQMPRPDVDAVHGLPPTVSIEQRISRGGGKSTVATVTEIYHFIRLLYTKLGVIHCPTCELPVQPQTHDALVSSLKKEAKKRGDLLLLAPRVRNRKGFHTDVGEWAARHGYEQVRADGRFHPTAKPLRLDRYSEHDVEAVIGRLRKRGSKNVAALVAECLAVGQGTLFAIDDSGGESVHSTANSCGGCGRSFAPLDPKDFSYNSARGWCPTCRGFGETFYIPDIDRGDSQEAVEETWFGWQEENRELCTDCDGARLAPLARAVRLPLPRLAKRDFPDEPTIDAFAQASVGAAGGLFASLKWRGRGAEIARDIVPEIASRLDFLGEVGLDYLQLGRAVTTLSGGEAQRIRLAAQLGSNLSGVLYVLDEPTIGLHPRDNQQLLGALEQLRSRGNSVVVVEHDDDTMARADHIIDLGPGAGVEGGQVVATGSLKQILRNKQSLTGIELARQNDRGQALNQARPTTPPLTRRGASLKNKTPSLIFRGLNRNNLKNISVAMPLGRFTVVTGVSGSGKSTLVRDCILPAVQADLKAKRKKTIDVIGQIKAVHEVDQSPIGRTPRSVPATYVGFFDTIRQLFSQVPEARMRGFSPARFSFNSAQGRCPDCKGAGIVKLEMNFLPPAFMTCDTCDGSRYSPEVLDIVYNGKTIAGVLELSVNEAADLFGAIPKIHRALKALQDTGLGYLKLGQTSPTLSGGEAQRVKLVTHLLSGLSDSTRLKADNKKNLFLLEEPTIGLHMADVRRLVKVLQRLVEGGHTVLVIEHNLDLIAAADWIIDLGPEGGQAGGQVIAQGPPQQVTKAKISHTGRFLKRFFN